MPVRAGERLKIRANDWNDCLAAAEAYKTGVLGSARDNRWGFPPHGMVLLKNSTGVDRSRFEILGLGDPVWTPTENLSEFQNSIAFDGEAVAIASHFGKFAVLMEAVRSGAFGLAVIHGVCNVQIDVVNEAHEFADIEDAASDTLKSYTAGSAKILWKEAGTGDKWARVLLNASSGITLWRFVLNAAFAGSPSSASCDLLNLDGTDTGQDVTVYDWLDVFSADLTTDDVGYCVRQGNIYTAIQAPCPPEA